MTEMPAFNFGDMLESLEIALPPQAEALVELHSEHAVRRTWLDLRRRTNNLGHAMLAAGAQPSDKVACYLRNGNAYMETLCASFKARLTPVNVNYRYRAEELFYILDNSDSTVVVYAAEFRPLVEDIRHRLPAVRLWLEVTEAGQPPAEFATDYESVAEDAAYDGAVLQLERSGEDLLFLYTGGTTGYPKGVMWEHKALWLSLNANIEQSKFAHTVTEHTQKTAERYPGQRQLPACPMMHGTGLFSALHTLLNGGCVVSIVAKRFDAVQFWDAVQREQVSVTAIVGDAFAKPMLQALHDHPERWDLSSLQHIVSSGTMFSPQLKQQLNELLPNLQMADNFGSSEGLGFGSSVSGKGEKDQSARFTIGRYARVFDEDHRPIEPGSDQIGFIATTVTIPVGYYKDPEKTAKTFPIIDGVRYSIPGDYCRLEADGTIILLGRGSG